MPLGDSEFQSLLARARELHRRADEVTRQHSRFYANVQARLSWEHDAPALPSEQRDLADEAVELLSTPKLSSSQARQLRRVFFGT